MEALNFLLGAIVLAFASLMLMDFTGGLIELWNTSNPQTAIVLQQFPATLPFNLPTSTDFTTRTEIIEDPWKLAIATKKRPTWASMGQIHNFEEQLLLPPAPTTTDIGALDWADIKKLAQGRVQGWNRMKKADLIRAIAEAQLTRNDLAQLRAA